MIKQPTFRTKVEEQSTDYARLVIEPLEQGFGQTLGNALRRVLLTHIRGAAVTSVQIKGVNHQFRTFEGMREDVVDLILNIKQIKIAYQGEEPVTAKLKAQGPGEVTAGQIELPANVEIANPDLVLANLADSKSKLEVTMTIESGQGYSPAEERMVNELGVIPTDAIYSPVVRVNFKVTDTRVGRKTNYDKLILDVWSDGSVEPEKAVKEAAEILNLYFKQIVNPVSEPEEEQTSQIQSEPEVYRITVEELELPTRIANALRKAGLGTVKDLASSKKENIMKIKNLGGKSADIVEEALKAKGLNFADQEKSSE